MMKKQWNLPEKRNYVAHPESKFALWSTAEGGLFIDAEIEFGRCLSIEEKREVLRFIVVRLKQGDVCDHFDIVFLNFFSSKEILITFQVFDGYRDMALFTILVDLKKYFFVKRIGNVEYTDEA